MELNELYEDAQLNNIDINDWSMKHTKARIIDDGNSTNIFLDYGRIHSYVEEKDLLGEELGHYHTGAYYTFNSDQTLINKQEYKAKKWQILNMCPLTKLNECYYNGLTNEYEIADALDLSPELVIAAMKYYKNNK